MGLKSSEDEVSTAVYRAMRGAEERRKLEEIVVLDYQETIKRIYAVLNGLNRKFDLQPIAFAAAQWPEAGDAIPGLQKLQTHYIPFDLYVKFFKDLEAKQKEGLVPRSSETLSAGSVYKILTDRKYEPLFRYKVVTRGAIPGEMPQVKNGVMSLTESEILEDITHALWTKEGSNLKALYARALLALDQRTLPLTQQK